MALINLNDRGSYLRLMSYPCWLGDKRVNRHANAGDYQTALRLAFVDWGLPPALQVDHESVFYDNKTKSPFPTPLHLWLVALGVTLHFWNSPDLVDNLIKAQSMSFFKRNWAGISQS